MSSRYVVSGQGGQSIKEEIDREIDGRRFDALALAVAYVSTYGARYICDLQRTVQIKQVALIADIGDGISHPQAFRIALDKGWRLRAVSAKGTFHPKLMVFGGNINENGTVGDPRIAVVGSVNLSRGGLDWNTECSLLRSGTGELSEAADAFHALWQRGDDFDAEQLRLYEPHFEKRNRSRTPRDLKLLGVADEEPLPEDFRRSTEPAPVRGRRVPSDEERSLGTNFAAAAWAGLESYTGEYTLQVEFPKHAGAVLYRLFSAHGHTEDATCVCTDDVERRMNFHYYNDNAMFRLNIPNETPDVDWARSHRSGLALVEERDDGRLAFRVVRPGRETMDVIGRSMALGTWGRTRTRLYGWY